MFLINKNEELTPIILGKVLCKFQTEVLPKLKVYWDYYCGKQKIVFKTATDEGKPCNKVVVNFCKHVVDNYNGYLSGIPITYSNDGDFDEVIDVLKYNDVITEDNELLRQALIFGKAFEINYIDEDGKQRFRNLDTRECIPIYDNTLNNDLMYVVRFYGEDLLEDVQESYIVEVYSAYDVKIYRSTPMFSSFELIGTERHFFNQVPVTVFSLNKDEKSIFDQVMSMQDAYNSLVSDEIDDFDAFCDAYLVLKGITADEEDLAKMKKNRVLILDPDSDASYLTKSISDTQVQNLQGTIEDKIHKIANCPDFTDEKLTVNSGIALRLKLVGFENQASSIEANMRKALIKRIELISEILKLTNAEYVWRDVNIVFTRNLPVETENIATMVNTLRGLVSTKTLLQQLPFVTDVDEEYKAVEEEKAKNMDLFRDPSFVTESEDFGIND